MEVEFGWGGGGGGGGGVQTHFYVKPISVKLSWGCVEVELGLWQYYSYDLQWPMVPNQKNHTNQTKPNKTKQNWGAYAPILI